MTYWIYYYKKRSPNRMLIQEGGLSSNPYTELNPIHSLKIWDIGKSDGLVDLNFISKKLNLRQKFPVPQLILAPSLKLLYSQQRNQDSSKNIKVIINFFILFYDRQHWKVIKFFIFEPGQELFLLKSLLLCGKTLSVKMDQLIKAQLDVCLN